MPHITNVGLSIQPTDSPNTTRLSVSYTVEFSRPEILAGQVFEFKSKIVPFDGSFNGFEGTGTRQIRRRFIKAESGSISRTDSDDVQRLTLDEDSDFIPFPATRGDEWFAKVTATPAVFHSSERTSELVTGSWGGV